MLILATIIIVSFLLFFDFGESSSRILNTIVSFGHLPLFGVVSLVILRVISNGMKVPGLKHPYIASWIITSASGALTECIQAITTYRHFRLGDIYTDILGAAIFLMITYVHQTRPRHRYITWMTGGLLLLIIIRAYPIIVSSIDKWNMERTFPVLISFETPFELSRLLENDETVNRTQSHATEGDYSIHVQLTPGEYPGITIKHIMEDWRGYSYLSFDVFIEGLSSLPLTIRINDRTHNEKYEDRYNQTFNLQPGLNHVTISLSEVEHAPKGRLMDMEHISILCLFSYKLKEQRTVYFDNFRLEKKD